MAGWGERREKIMGKHHVCDGGCTRSRLEKACGLGGEEVKVHGSLGKEIWKRGRVPEDRGIHKKKSSEGDCKRGKIRVKSKQNH